MPDTNVLTALGWAYEIGPSPELPQSLSFDIEHRAGIVNSTNGILIEAPIELKNLSIFAKQQLLDSLCTNSATLLSDVSEGITRSNVLLRLWSGCLMAAKTIALSTTDGPVTPGTRTQNFKEIKSSWIPKDPVFVAGVESAPAFKKLHREYYSFDGVPADSEVRRYPNEYLVK